MAKKIFKNKLIIIIALIILFLIIIPIMVAHNKNNKLVENNINTINNIKYYEGEDVSFYNIKLGELIRNENGYNFYGLIKLDNVPNIVNKVSEQYNFGYTVYSLEQNIEYNNTKSIYNIANIKKSYCSYNENKDNNFSITAYAKGEYSKYVSDIVVTATTDNWEINNKIVETILKDLNFENDLIDSIIKSGNKAGIELYYNNNESVTLSILKTEGEKCETTISFTHNSSKLDKAEIVLPYGYEDINKIASNTQLVLNNNNKNNFNIIGETFGLSLLNELNQELGNENAVSMTSSTFNGIKDSNGLVINEEFNFITALSNEDNSERITVTSYYDSSKCINSFEISTDDETFDNEEVEIINEYLVKFLDYINSENNIKTLDIFEKVDEYNQSALMITDNTDRNYTVTHGYMENAYAISSTANNTVYTTRSSDIDTYY